MSLEPRLMEKPKQFREILLEDLARRPLLAERFTSQVTKNGETTLTRWKVVSVTLEGEPGDAEFRLNHPQKGMKDVLLRSGRLFQKFDLRDITNEFYPETTGQQRQDTQRKVEAA